MAEWVSSKKMANLSRRFLLARAAAAGLAIAWNKSARAAIVQTGFSKLPPYGNGTLPSGVRLRH
jgi:hypothetical protein